jgi:hypothetical protein
MTMTSVLKLQYLIFLEATNGKFRDTRYVYKAHALFLVPYRCLLGVVFDLYGPFSTLRV